MSAPTRTTTGPRIGHAFVVDGVEYRSSQQRPTLALIDLQTQIGQANPGRYALGLPPHEAPASALQLRPLFATANPRHTPTTHGRRRTDARRIAGPVMA
jgi:hypothetical protein